MQWIALQWQPESGGESHAPPLPAEALGWWALRFTPHVSWLDEALMLEISACERLWGGRHRLVKELDATHPLPGSRLRQAQGATALVALACLRLLASGVEPPVDLPAALPLHTLTAARNQLDLLARMGCRTWGDVAALPRGGLSRRFGAGLREALDEAWGLRPSRQVWLTLPEVFEQKIELPALAETAPELMWSAQRLLGALQVWLRSRQRGALALELQWTLDLRRSEGVDLPPSQGIVVRTAESTQDIAHLRRLMVERLAITRLSAPASWLRLRSLETTPWAGASASFLPEDNRQGDRLHELVERLSARLGAQQVVVAVSHADHRPERMQVWLPAQGRALAAMAAPARAAKAALAAAVAAPATTSKTASAEAARAGHLFPAWVLQDPLRLDVQDGHPCYQGRLRPLVGPQKLETGWWSGIREDEGRDAQGGGVALRDYYIAESPRAGLVWVFCERLPGGGAPGDPRWFLQGLYA